MPEVVLHTAHSAGVRHKLQGICRGHNPAIHTFHTRLCLWGKPGKMVLVATMHKLFHILNAVVRDQAPRQQNSVPTVTKPCQPTALLSNCLTEHGNTAEHRLLETDGKSIGIRC